jgi:signal transduction histidine kinase
MDEAVPFAPGTADRPRARSRVLAVGALGTLLMLAAAGLGLLILDNVTTGQRWVTHTIEVQLQAERVRTDLRGLGRAVLDSLTVHDAGRVDLGPWERQARDDMARLQALVADNPQQSERAESLARALSGHITFLRQLRADDTAALAERRERAEANEALISAFVEQETRLLQQRQQQLNASTRWQAVLIVVLGLMALSTLVATMGLWQQMARHQARADAAAQRSMALEQARQQLAGLARQLLSVEEQERSALARELHDDFGQRLAALKMNVQMAQRLLPNGPPMLSDAVAIIDDCIGRVRQRAFSLRPAPLDVLGLDSALKAHVDEQARLAGVRATVTVRLGDWRPPESWSSHVFRIVQEAVRNAIVHGQPQGVAVSLTAADGECTLTVVDDGAGFVSGREGGMGLLNMRERCELLGGRFEIGPAEPRGTRVLCRWPMG